VLQYETFQVSFEISIFSNIGEIKGLTKELQV